MKFWVSLYVDTLHINFTDFSCVFVYQRKSYCTCLSMNFAIRMLAYGIGTSIFCKRGNDFWPWCLIESTHSVSSYFYGVHSERDIINTCGYTAMPISKSYAIVKSSFHSVPTPLWKFWLRTSLYPKDINGIFHAFLCRVLLLTFSRQRDISMPKMRHTALRMHGIKIFLNLAFRIA